MPVDPHFLDLEDVLEGHEEQLRLFGGAAGIRDVAGLESAMGQPSIGFGEAWAHVDLEGMAAAYLFHLSQAPAFIDGNKRVGLWSALTFLSVNGIVIDAPWEDVADLTLVTAEGKCTKDDIAHFFRTCPREG